MSVHKPVMGTPTPSVRPGQLPVLSPQWFCVHSGGLTLNGRRGHGSTPPYVVRWLDTNHEALVFPGSDAHIEPAHAKGTPG